MKTLLLISIFIISSSTSFSQIDLNSGLVAYYPFNGDANDVSGNGNNAVFNNATLVSGRSGNPNSAYSFNGTDNYIQIPNSPSLNPGAQISLCASVKVNGFYSGSCHGNDIINKGQYAANPGSYFLRFDDYAYTNGLNCVNPGVDEDHQNFYGWGTAIAPGYSPYIQKNQWYCVIYTYDGTVAKLYVDGILQSQSSTSLMFNNSNDLYLGRLYYPSLPNSFPYWFNGIMDEIRIYNRAINDQEVDALCNSFTLAVNVTEFSTNVINNQILLSWKLETEEGINNYSIQRSTTGNSDFETIGRIASGNIHSYSFIDNTAKVNQVYYYRLAILEKSNQLTYSAIRTAKIIGKNRFITLYPNPSNGIINLRFDGFTGKMKLTLINSMGQVVLEKDGIIYNNNLFPLSLNKQASGTYWLKVKTNTQQFVEKIIVR